jgi:tRNA A-37 threonylcarbamoyl transferase component Bud32
MKFAAFQNKLTVSLTAAICVDGILGPNPNWSRSINQVQLSIMTGEDQIITQHREPRQFNRLNFTWTWINESYAHHLTQHSQISVDCRLLYRETSMAEANHAVPNRLAKPQTVRAGIFGIQASTPSMTRTEVERGLLNAPMETVRADSDNATQANPQASDVPNFGSKLPSEVPYKFISELGARSSSRVDEVQHTITKRHYARKSIRWNASESIVVRKIILREAGAIQRLSHDHVVSVYCIYREPRSINVLITPIAEGNLAWYLEKVSDENFPESSLKLLRTWFACLVGGLAHVHKNKTSHKNIKPNNILVKGSNILLTDFSIARELIDEFTSSTQNGRSAETFMYCAPEAADDVNQRNRSADVFSLGCVFVEMATVLAKKSVAEFYHMRKVGETHAYFRTLDIVQSWMANHAVLPYSRFIALMLSVNRSARPTVWLVKVLIETGGLDGKEGIACIHGRKPPV